MNKSDLSLNMCMLKGPLAKNGYDRWRHQFTGYNQETGVAKTFFVEYFACNPAIGNGHPILGQLPINQAIGRRPSYTMVKAGIWGENAKQLNNFYACSKVEHAKEYLHVIMGDCELSETHLKGICSVSERDAVEHPEYMSDAGEMTWALQIQKKIAYNSGFVTSKMYRRFNALENFWHAEGIRTEYSGSVTLDGVKYVVFPETSFGYADKHWGTDFGSPWIWISGCDLKSTTTGKALDNSAFVFKGCKHAKFDNDLSQQIEGGLYYEGKMYQYSIKKNSPHTFEFKEDEGTYSWVMKAENNQSILMLTLTCSKSDMLSLNYEAPDGTRRFNDLWSGGTGRGTIELYGKTRNGNQLIDQIDFQNAGCEYGTVEA